MTSIKDIVNIYHHNFVYTQGVSTAFSTNIEVPFVPDYAEVKIFTVIAANAAIFSIKSDLFNNQICGLASSNNNDITTSFKLDKSVNGNYSFFISPHPTTGALANNDNISVMISFYLLKK